MAKNFDDILCLVCNSQISADKKGNYACPCCGMTYKSKILKDKRFDRIKEMVNLRLKGDFETSSIISTQLNQVHKDYTVMSKWNNYICSIKVILNADGVFAVSKADAKQNLDNLRYQEFLREAMKNDKTFCGSAILIHDKLKEFFDKSNSQEQIFENPEETLIPTNSNSDEADVEKYNTVDTADDIIDDDLVDDIVDALDETNVVSSNDIIVNVDPDDTLVEDQNNNVVVEDYFDEVDVLPTTENNDDLSETDSTDNGDINSDSNVLPVNNESEEFVDVAQSDDNIEQTEKDTSVETNIDAENKQNGSFDLADDTPDVVIEEVEEDDVIDLIDDDSIDSNVEGENIDEEKIVDSKLVDGKVLDIFAEIENESNLEENPASENQNTNVDPVDDELDIADAVEDNSQENQIDEPQDGENVVEQIEGIDDVGGNNIENSETSESEIKIQSETENPENQEESIQNADIDEETRFDEVDNEKEISIENQPDEISQIDEYDEIDVETIGDIDVDSSNDVEEDKIDEVEIEDFDVDETITEKDNISNEVDVDIQENSNDTYATTKVSSSDLVSEFDIDAQDELNEYDVAVGEATPTEQTEIETISNDTLDEELSINVDEELANDSLNEKIDETETDNENDIIDVENTTGDILDIAESKIKSDVQETRKEGVEIIKQQSKEGVSRAMYLYGQCWENGICLIKNSKNALSWYKKAFENGFIDAESDVTRLEEVIANKEPKTTKPKISKSKNYLAEGIRCYNEKDYANACELFKNACAKKDPLAYFYYAVCCEYGLGCETNPDDAFKYYGLAVKAGNENALFYLAQCYQKGFGCDKNTALALKYYKKSAETGNAKAEYKISRCYKQGAGVEKNLKTAFKWALASAEHGNPDAVNDVAWYYVSGSGVKKDYENAVKWYKIASEKGDANAMFNLAICYEQGYGVEKNEEEALKLYKKASKLGNESAKKRLKVLKK